MSVIQIVCQNCGAKYKLPESFQADKAKCKECGTAIDVAAQRNQKVAAPGTAAAPAKASPAPAKARPAAARPAETRTRSTESPAANASSRPSRARRGTDDAAEGDSGKGRRRTSRGEGEAKKGPNMALLGGGLLLVAGVVVTIIFVLNGKGDDTGRTDSANANPASQGVANPTDKPVVSPSNPADPKAGGSGEGTAKPDANPAEATANTGAGKPADSKPADAKPADAKPADAKGGSKITSVDQVFDPSTLEDLPYPDEIAQEVRDEVNSLVPDIDGSATVSARRAKARLEELGYPAMFGLANRLRTFDYKSREGTMNAYELNRLMEVIAKGTNASFKPPQQDDLTLDQMDWNGKTVKTWQNFLRQLSTKEKYDAYLKQKEAALQKQGKKN